MLFRRLESLLVSPTYEPNMAVRSIIDVSSLGCLLGRPIVNKHRAYTFHRPSALWLAQIFVDVAFASTQILVFSIVVYFACGLVRDAGAFFTFYLVIVTGYLAMTLFFRTVACLCSSFDVSETLLWRLSWHSGLFCKQVALKSAVVIITLFVLTSGYLIQYAKEQVWLRWIFYISEFRVPTLPEASC